MPTGELNNFNIQTKDLAVDGVSLNDLRTGKRTSNPQILTKYVVAVVQVDGVRLCL
jgi:hypothetical protein